MTQSLIRPSLVGITQHPRQIWGFAADYLKNRAHLTESFRIMRCIRDFCAFLTGFAPKSAAPACPDPLSAHPNRRTMVTDRRGLDTNGHKLPGLFCRPRARVQAGLNSWK